MADETNSLPKMMLGFVVRRCAVDLGHSPNAAELAAWANNHSEHGRPHCLFGHPITEREAGVILKHQARLVSAKSAAEHECYVEEDESAQPPAGSNVVSIAVARARRLRLRKPGSNGSGRR